MLRIQRRKPAATIEPLSPDERRFARGTRSLADLVAPAAVEIARDHVRLEYQYARVLAVTGYPRSVGPGWLAPLIEFEHPIELSIHIHPLETASGWMWMLSSIGCSNSISGASQPGPTLRG